MHGEYNVKLVCTNTNAPHDECCTTEDCSWTLHVTTLPVIRVSIVSPIPIGNEKKNGAVYILHLKNALVRRNCDTFHFNLHKHSELMPPSGMSFNASVAYTSQRPFYPFVITNSNVYLHKDIWASLALLYMYIGWREIRAQAISSVIGF
jgi:hypothetical protein